MYARTLIEKFISLARAAWDIKDCKDGVQNDVSVAGYLHGVQVLLPANNE